MSVSQFNIGVNLSCKCCICVRAS